LGLPRLPPCKLIGEDGNVFAIIGRVRSALRKDGQADRMDEFTRRATAATSYDGVLVLLHEYVKVK